MRAGRSAPSNGEVPTPDTDVLIDSALVERLLAQQCPSLAGLPVTALDSGWDNAIFRLGDSLAVRLPRRAPAAPLVQNEMTWLPVLEPLLTLDVPQPVFAGTPGAGYPYPWMVAPWFDGTRASDVPLPARTAFAEELADFLWTLHAPAPAHAPINPVRGMALTAPDGPDARARVRLAREKESTALLRRWEAWSRADEFDGVDVWLHGDLHPANLIVAASGRLSAVIDWGDLTAGDPACDLATVWLTFDADGRAVFVDRLNQGGATDAATWQRAKAWALHLALVLHQECEAGTALQAVGTRALEALIEENP